MSTPEDHDAKIVERILDGDTNEYEKLVDRHSPMVFHLVRRFTQNEEVAKDLAQQVFVKAYDKLSSFRGNAKFSSWLYRLTMNQCRDYAKNVRRKNKHFSEMEEYELNIELGHSDTPQESYEQKESEELLYKALEQLPDDYAEPLLLKYRDGMSYKVMSDRLGVSVSALKVRVHRARKELKQIMDDQL